MKLSSRLRAFILHPSALILFFALLASASLLAPGYFDFAHDARHSVYLFQMFDANIREGVLIPRWGADVTFGYGYPVWIIFAPLPYYAAELFHLVGFDFVWSVKLVDLSALLAAPLAMYLFASRVLGKNAGVVAAVAYAFVPYHLVDMYVRAAWPETISFVWLPLILWAMHELVTTRAKKYIALVALPYGALILTHVITTFLFSLVVGAYILFLWLANRRALTWRAFIDPVLAILLGIGIGALFLFPSVLENQYLSAAPFTGDFFDFRKHYISLAQMLSPFWGYGYAGINGNDQFSLQLGVIPLALALMGLFVTRKGKAEIRAHAWFFALVSVAALFGMLSPAQPLWELVARVGSYVQFPWRLLSVTAFALAFLCGIAANYFDDLLVTFAFAFVLALAMFPNAQPQYTDARFTNQTLMDFEVNSHELLGDTIWLTGERPTDSPLVAQYVSGAPLQKAVALDNDAQVTMLEHYATGDTARVNSPNGARVLFYTHYFPGWAAYVDGQRTNEWEVYPDQGLILVRVPAGEHIVETRFGTTTDRVVGEVTTGVSLLIAFALLWRGARKSSPQI